MPSETSRAPFDLLSAYLHGTVDAHQLRTAFTKGTHTHDAFAIYKDTPFTEEQKQRLETELGVGVGPDDAKVEHADNLLDLIDNLNKAGYGYGQLADFRYQLKKIHPEPDWTGTLLFTTLLTGIISTFFFSNQKQLERLEGALLRVAPFIAPVFLIGSQVYTVFRQAYKTRYEDTYHEDSHRKRRWVVGTFPSLLNLSAYVAIAAIGSMSPLAAALFVSASFVAVLDSAISFYQIYTAEKQEKLDTASAARQNNRKERTGQTFWVKMYAAVALSATVAISCIFPPSIFVVLSCTALFILIPMTKNSWLNKIHTDSSQQLLAKLRDIEDTDTAPAKENIPGLDVIHHQARKTERQSYKNKLDAAPSRVGLFKPAMVDLRAVSGGDSSNAIEASFLSPHL